MRRAVILAAGVALVCASTALAGGWATVQLSSSPRGIAAGEPWIVEVTVLQHGLRTQPLSGLKPTVTIRKVTRARALSSGLGELKEVSRTFKATATRRAGVYRARVVFPSAGTWRYEVYDAFQPEYGGDKSHTFAPVKIAARGT
jgi:hypothetical protein